MSPFKSSVGRNLGKLLKSYRTFNLGDSFPQAPTSFSATGGDYILTPGNGFKYHTFTSSGSFVSSGGPKNVEFLLVAGGGGGGGVDSSASGGGGGGGMVISSGFACAGGTHPIDVGGGGTGQTGQSGPINPGGDSVFTYNGSPSAFVATAKGGGGGDGPQAGGAGDPGGCGGGFGGNEIQSSQNTDISHISNYGNAAPAEGGGGAGAAGGDGPDVGGAGQPAPGYEYPLILPPPLATPLEPYSPSNNHYAGGGAGYPTPSDSGNSLGGGGAGMPADNGNGNPGIDRLGGGGGFSWNPTTATGGSGGDGIVVIRYAV